MGSEGDNFSDGTSFPELGTSTEDVLAVASPRLDDDQLARAAGYGVRRTVSAGELLYQVGEASADLVVCETATLASYRTTESESDPFLVYRPGEFTGELSVLTRATRNLAVLHPHRRRRTLGTGPGPARLPFPDGSAVSVAGQHISRKGVVVGGQAATSARIENYLGFPFGLSGLDLTTRAVVQALKFDANIVSPCPVASLSTTSDGLLITLTDGTQIKAGTALIATGAAYRSLPIERWDEFVGNGIYHAATDIEAQSIAGEAVTVVGGANSAGQAALHLARYADHVTLVVRGTDLGAEACSASSSRSPRPTGWRAPPSTRTASS
ncbi:NAD(P)-binding domain-containing protein [Kribbella sp. NPDC006257]|uniref:NAD(P)-binding domain-containing protein n=1 Tax=Kribbella sp. NPDC006257 TaxID=3156738 RepID=UPI0033AE62B2